MAEGQFDSSVKPSHPRRAAGEPMSDWECRLARRIRTRRIELGLSRAELAKRVGVSERSITNWETRTGAGAITLRSFQALCAALDVQPIYLLTAVPLPWVALLASASEVAEGSYRTIHGDELSDHEPLPNNAAWEDLTASNVHWWRSAFGLEGVASLEALWDLPTDVVGRLREVIQSWARGFDESRAREADDMLWAAVQAMAAQAPRLRPAFLDILNDGIGVEDTSGDDGI